MNWRKSTYSSDSSTCVEFAPAPEGALVRDSTDPDGPVLEFSASDWQAFISGLKTR